MKNNIPFILTVWLLLSGSFLFGQELSYKQLSTDLRSKSLSEKVERLEKFISLADPTKDDRVRAVDRLCRELAAVGRRFEAEKWVEKGKLWATEIDAKFVLMKLYQVEAAIACELAQYERSEMAASKSIAMADNSPWKSFAVIPLTERGICLTHLNRYAEAIKDFESALEIADRKKRDDWKLRVLTNLAPTFGSMGQRDKEVATLQQAMAIANKHNDLHAVATLTVNVGNSFLAIKKFDEAGGKFDEALELAERNSLPDVKAIALTGLGDILVKKNKLGSAKSRYQEAQEIYQKIHDPLGLVQIKSRITAIDEKLRVVSAETQISELNQLLVEAKEIGNRELIVSLLDQLIDVYKRQSNWERTLEHLDKRQEIEREIWTQQSHFANEQLVSNQKQLIEQKQTSNLLVVVSLVLFAMACVATALWHVKRLAAEKLQIDNEIIRQNEKIKLSEQQKIAQREKSESIAMMSAGIIHDFNNFLSAIVSSAELGRLLDNSDKKDELFESILSTGLSASELTRNLSDFIGHGKISNSQCEIVSVIADETEFLNQLVDAKIDVVVSSDSASVWVNFDAVEIKQILSNLVKNAGEALQNRIGEIKIEIRTDFEAAVCTLVVRDNGSGMDADMIERATEPFYSTKGVGRGLGLASVKGVVERNGGTVSISSNPGEGCEFRIRMSIVEPENQNVRQRKTTQESKELCLKRILVVEDEEAIRNRVTIYLEKLGGTVVATNSVEAAIETIESEPQFDCVITDFLLADQSGRFLAKNVRAMSPSTPILLVSGYAEKDVFESDLFDDFVPKPFRLNQLLAAINRLHSVQNP